MRYGVLFQRQENKTTIHAAEACVEENILTSNNSWNQSFSPRQNQRTEKWPELEHRNTFRSKGCPGRSGAEAPSSHLTINGQAPKSSSGKLPCQLFQIFPLLTHKSLTKPQIGETDLSHASLYVDHAIKLFIFSKFCATVLASMHVRQWPFCLVTISGNNEGTNVLWPPVWDSVAPCGLQALVADLKCLQTTLFYSDAFAKILQLHEDS